MSFSEVIAPLLGRIAIGWYLITQAWGYAQDWSGTMDMLQAHHIAAPPVLFGLFLAIMCELALGVTGVIWLARRNAQAQLTPPPPPLG